MPFLRLPGLPFHSAHPSVLRPLSRGRCRPAGCSSRRLARPFRACNRGPTVDTSRVRGRLSPVVHATEVDNPPGLFSSLQRLPVTRGPCDHSGGCSCEPSAEQRILRSRLAELATLHPDPATAFETLSPSLPARDLARSCDPATLMGFQRPSGCCSSPESSTSLEAGSSLTVDRTAARFTARRADSVPEAWSLRESVPREDRSLRADDTLVVFSPFKALRSTAVDPASRVLLSFASPATAVRQ